MSFITTPPTAEPSNTSIAVAGNRAVIADDRQDELLVSATATLTFAAPAVLGVGWFTRVKVTGADGIVVTVAASSGLIDGLASYAMYPGDERRFYVNAGATAILSDLETPGRAVFTSSGNLTVPPGITFLDLDGVSAAAGGGYGVSIGGGGGGGGGRAIKRVYLAQAGIAAGAVLPVVIGAGGTGGVNGTPNGVAGGLTSIGTLLSVAGGEGTNETALPRSYGGAGGGVAQQSPGGGNPTFPDGYGGGAGGQNDSGVSQYSPTPGVYGGGGGGSGRWAVVGTAALSQGATSQFAGGGGGGGAAGAGNPGGAGGASGGYTTGGGGAAGGDGVAGSAGANGQNGGCGGGGGGGGSASVGGAGGLPGGGGGGGAPNRSGGVGGRGEARITWG